MSLSSSGVHFSPYFMAEVFSVVQGLMTHLVQLVAHSYCKRLKCLPPPFPVEINTAWPIISDSFRDPPENSLSHSESFHSVEVETPLADFQSTVVSPKQKETIS